MLARRFCRHLWSEADRHLWDYRRCQLRFSATADDYELTRQIGRGKFSMVYEAIDLRTREAVVLKALNHDMSERIAREILVLNALRGAAPEVAQLRAAVVEPATPLYALVFEECGQESLFRLIGRGYDLGTVKAVMRDVLRGLKAAHDRSIIHRDVKHTNIIFNVDARRARIVDWGQAEFYFSGQPLTLRIATRAFKPPEVLLGWPHYDFSVDMWGAGHVLACLLFRLPHLFQATDEQALLEEMTQELGAGHMADFCRQHAIALPPRVALAFARHAGTRCSLVQRFSPQNAGLFDLQGLNLLEGLLCLDPRGRLDAEAALAHPFLAALSP